MKEENVYEFKATFLDEDCYLLNIEYMPTTAYSTEEAEERLCDELDQNNILYPSDNYEIKLIDVY